jgi:hypothetical protein
MVVHDRLRLLAVASRQSLDKPLMILDGVGMRAP